MTSFLEKFRAQYPQGCLSADLVSVHDGQYIVRAVASNQGAPLATGLAASVDLQIAEDKARERAIALLGLGLDLQTTPQRDAQPKSVSSKSVSSKSVSSESSKSNGHQKLETEAHSVAVKTEERPMSAPAPVASAPEEVEVTLEPPEAEPDPTDDEGPPLEAIAEQPQSPSAATIALENFNTSPNPVNLSDVIAQTDVELMRLGWTNDQGRAYLEKTYGKRSRQQLTDEELMTFLLYLEEQA